MKLDTILIPPDAAKLAEAVLDTAVDLAGR